MTKSHVLTSLSFGVHSPRRCQYRALLCDHENKRFVIIVLREEPQQADGRFGKALQCIAGRLWNKTNPFSWRDEGPAYRVVSIEIEWSAIAGLDYRCPLHDDGKLVLEARHVIKRCFKSVEDVRDFYSLRTTIAAPSYTLRSFHSAAPTPHKMSFEGWPALPVPGHTSAGTIAVSPCFARHVSCGHLYEQSVPVAPFSHAKCTRARAATANGAVRVSGSSIGSSGAPAHVPPARSASTSRMSRSGGTMARGGGGETGVRRVVSFALRSSCSGFTSAGEGGGGEPMRRSTGRLPAAAAVGAVEQARTSEAARGLAGGSSSHFARRRLQLQQAEGLEADPGSGRAAQGGSADAPASQAEQQQQRDDAPHRRSRSTNDLENMSSRAAGHGPSAGGSHADSGSLWHDKALGTRCRVAALAESCPGGGGSLEPGCGCSCSCCAIRCRYQPHSSCGGLRQPGDGAVQWLDPRVGTTGSFWGREAPARALAEGAGGVPGDNRASGSGGGEAVVSHGSQGVEGSEQGRRARGRGGVALADQLYAGSGACGSGSGSGSGAGGDAEVPRASRWTRPTATYYSSTLVLSFRDPFLPQELRRFVKSDMRLLKLYESGLPAWAIFLPCYGLPYRPWMRRALWLLFIAISIFSMGCGFYDLYKNVPFLKQVMTALASRMYLPASELFEWLERHTQIRMSILLTYLFSKSPLLMSLMRMLRSLAALLQQLLRPAVVALSTALTPLGAAAQAAVAAVGGGAAAIAAVAWQVVQPAVAAAAACGREVGELVLGPPARGLWALLVLVAQLVRLMAALVGMVLVGPLQLACSIGGALSWMGSEAAEQLAVAWEGVLWALQWVATLGRAAQRVAPAVKASARAAAQAASSASAVAGGSGAGAGLSGGVAVWQWLGLEVVGAYNAVRLTFIQAFKSAQAVMNFLVTVAQTAVQHRVSLLLQIRHFITRQKERLPPAVAASVPLPAFVSMPSFEIPNPTPHIPDLLDPDPDHELSRLVPGPPSGTLRHPVYGLSMGLFDETGDDEEPQDSASLTHPHPSRSLAGAQEHSQGLLFPGGDSAAVRARRISASHQAEPIAVPQRGRTSGGGGASGLGLRRRHVGGSVPASSSRLAASFGGVYRMSYGRLDAVDEELDEPYTGGYGSYHSMRDGGVSMQAENGEHRSRSVPERRFYVGPPAATLGGAIATGLLRASLDEERMMSGANAGAAAGRSAAWEVQEREWGPAAPADAGSGHPSKKRQTQEKRSQRQQQQQLEAVRAVPAGQEGTASARPRLPSSKDAATDGTCLGLSPVGKGTGAANAAPPPFAVDTSTGARGAIAAAIAANDQDHQWQQQRRRGRHAVKAAKRAGEEEHQRTSAGPDCQSLRPMGPRKAPSAVLSLLQDAPAGEVAAMIPAAGGAGSVPASGPAHGCSNGGDAAGSAVLGRRSKETRGVAAAGRSGAEEGGREGGGEGGNNACGVRAGMGTASSHATRQSVIRAS